MTTSVVVCTYCCAVLLMDYRNVGRQNCRRLLFIRLLLLLLLLLRLL